MSDNELVKLPGASAGKARTIIRSLDQNHAVTAFPQKLRIWENRRYRSAAEKWLNKTGPRSGVESSDQVSMRSVSRDEDGSSDREARHWRTECASYSGFTRAKRLN